ncbi:MAG: transposase [Acidiferrobacteraceae bacterium]
MTRPVSIRLLSSLTSKDRRQSRCLSRRKLQEALSVPVLPGKYRKHLRTTDRQGRRNEETRRRGPVIRNFPNAESTLSLVGTLLAKQNEQWIERRTLDRDKFNEWLAARAFQSFRITWCRRAKQRTSRPDQICSGDWTWPIIKGRS